MTSEFSTAQTRVIIMPVDDSQHCERAFNWYLKRAHRVEDKLILVHVTKPSYVTPHAGQIAQYGVIDGSRTNDEGTEKGKKVLDKYAKLCKNAGFLHEKTLRADSNVGSMLLKVAEEYFGNLIVIAARGMSKARRTLMGSVSSYVVNRSGIPVLMVPPAKRSSASFVAEIEEAEQETELSQSPRQ